MANVSVRCEVKYVATRKSGHKEVAQKIVKQELNLGVMTEDRFNTLKAYTASVNSATDLLPT